MRRFGLVPVKRLDSAKSRLRRVVVDRPALALEMLGKVLTALQGSGRLERVAVVSPDPRVAGHCQGAAFLLQPGGGLNRALDQGRAWALGEGAEGLLVTLADLPGLTAAGVQRLLDRAPEAPCLVLAPDRAGRGTNAMFQAPPDLLPFRFGRDSLGHHQLEAGRRGIPALLHHDPQTMLDLDTPEQLLEWETP